MPATERATPHAAGVEKSAEPSVRTAGGEWEIIVVDNASTDQTAACAEPFVDGERVRLLHNGANRGKGFSIRRGMLAAR